MTFEIFEWKNGNGYTKELNELKHIIKKYKTFMHGHYVLDYPWVIKQLPKNINNLKIMDAGAGYGSLQYYLYEKGADVYSVDKVQYPLKQPKKNFHIIITELACERKYIPFKNNFFDYIVSVSALEHNLPMNFENSIRNLMKLIKVGGKLILTLPFGIQNIIGSNMLICSPSMKDFIYSLENTELDTIMDNTDDIMDLFYQFIQDTKYFYKSEDRKYFVPGGIVLRKIK